MATKSMQADRLLTRDEFREKIRNRDGRCVGCQISKRSSEAAAQSQRKEEVQELEVHHIIERKLFSDGGYFLWNGVGLCGLCHLDAEQSKLLPIDFYHWFESRGISYGVGQKLWEIFDVSLDQEELSNLNKWGELLFVVGGRNYRERYLVATDKGRAGEEPMQADQKYVKYPRTMHLPWSPNLQNDDRRIEDMSVLENCNDIVVTEKMDGENTTFYNDHLHARSLSSADHPSRSWVKQHWASIRGDIPDRMRICGENLYACHSIHYQRLESYFQVFNIWMGDRCLSWDETLEWSELIGLSTVRVLYRGAWDREILAELESRSDTERFEGYCVRVADEFRLSDYSRTYAKWVRVGHVQTDQHWMTQEVVPNKLA